MELRTLKEEEIVTGKCLIKVMMKALIMKMIAKIALKKMIILIMLIKPL